MLLKTRVLLLQKLIEHPIFVNFYDHENTIICYLSPYQP